MVIFDNLVLDLNGYERLHPGGKFNLLHNLGKDISKFFYGGYNLVNEPGKKTQTHSMAALDIVQTLTVGTIEGQAQVQDEKFKIFAKQQVNRSTATFTFASVAGKRIDNFKSWYNNPQMLGRHFVVYSAQSPRVKRQYTICSSMGKQVKKALLTLANNVIDSSDIPFDYKLMLGQDQSSIDLTMKSYGVEGGLATRVHSTSLGKDVSMAKISNENAVV